MKKKYLMTLLAALAAGSVLLFSGCGTDLTTIYSGETDISAELETENLSDGTILVHSIWYSSDGSKLSSAVVTLSTSDGELFSGTTDDSGRLEECSIPGNTTITCEITDSSGDVIAEAEIVFKLSSDYEDLTICLADSEAEDSQCILEIPTEKTDIRAAVFVTEDGGLSFVNLTPYTESDDTADDTQADGEAADSESSDSTDAQDTADGDTATGDDGTTAETSEGATADTGDGTATDTGDGTATDTGDGTATDSGDGTTADESADASGESDTAAGDATAQ